MCATGVLPIYFRVRLVTNFGDVDSVRVVDE